MPPKRAAHKRANSEKENASVAPKRARRRVSERMSGTAKSSYAEDSDDTSGSLNASNEDEASDFEDDGVEEEEAESSATASDDYSDEQSSARRRKSAGKGGGAYTTPPSHRKVTNRTVPRSKDLLMPGTTTSLEPGTQVIMKKPKARSAGKTPYEDHAIHPNTLTFLGDLAANNKREWLKMNDLDYRASLKDFTTFIEALSEKVIEIDDTVPELPTKDIIMRIYRDVRFSKDPTPYKSQFAACCSRTGRKGPFAKYYFHIKPGASVVAAGLWQPEAGHVNRMRRAVDRRSGRLKQVLREPNFRKYFLDGAQDNDRDVVKRFVHHSKEGALKTKPKGFDSDHKDIELLRLRSYVVRHKLRDDEVTSPTALDDVARLFSYVVPFVTYLNSVVMPDDDGQDGSSDDDQNDDEVEDDGDEDEEDEDQEDE